jgi:hypothetical protein
LHNYIRMRTVPFLVVTLSGNMVINISFRYGNKYTVIPGTMILNMYTFSCWLLN